MQVRQQLIANNLVDICLIKIFRHTLKEEIIMRSVLNETIHFAV